IRLIAEDFAAAEKGLAQVLKSHKAYVINSDVSGTPGQPRTGEWKIRVPVERFDDFQAAVITLGELHKTGIDSQDVTDAFNHVKGRMDSLQNGEKRLHDLLQKGTGKLEDVLKVEAELRRVRGEIEQLQGKLQLWTKLTDMATVTVFIHERGSYIP